MRYINMKRYLKTSNYIQTDLAELIREIDAIVFCDDAFSEDVFQYIRSAKSFDYNKLSVDQAVNLSDSDRAKITNIDLLRKLPLELLTTNQQIKVYQANKSDQITIKIQDVKNILTMLKNCNDIYRQGYRRKNKEFSDTLRAEGIVIRDVDVTNIVKQLSVKDFSHGKYSYELDSWCHLWAVFEFNNAYTFHDNQGNEIVKQNFRVYIKIETKEDNNGSVAVISFHDPEFDLKHPYKNYPVDKV